MKYICVFPLLCIFVTETSANCGIRRSSYNTRIVGGQDAGLGEFPWQVSLQKSNAHFCGAAIISEYWLVSASHCFPSAVYHNVSVVAGTVDRSSGGQSSTTAKVFLHAGYNDKNYDNDIALVLLKEPFHFSDNVKPICFPTDPNMDVELMNVCWVSGWGLTSAGSKSSAVKQQKLDMKEDTDCDWDLTPNMLCMKNDDSARSGCKGDSGGPLACQDKKTKAWILAGAVSFGNRQCIGSTVFSRVSKYINWVKLKTADAGRPFVPTHITGEAPQVILTRTVSDAAPVVAVSKIEPTQVEEERKVSAHIVPQTVSPLTIRKAHTPPPPPPSFSHPGSMDTAGKLTPDRVTVAIVLSVFYNFIIN
ncbi:serine protease 52-like [Protopterus annectens]|uniref:serine protease 52-like n=1 Tax=Protopterus annectens TaxID=7888 RepID=UPI001CFB62AC|nr:serine protease 52-like [Protopterus annectens]